MKRSGSAFALLASALLLAVAGCLGELSDLWELRAALIDRYGAGEVHVAVENGRRELTIGLKEPELQQLPAAEKAEMAKEVARFSSAHYARSLAVDAFQVKFVEEERWAWFFPFRREISFSFSPAELR